MISSPEGYEGCPQRRMALYMNTAESLKPKAESKYSFTLHAARRHANTACVSRLSFHVSRFTIHHHALSCTSCKALAAHFFNISTRSSGFTGLLK
jgi:hypothetical protein